MPHLDISAWAFEKLADKKWGVIGLKYRRVPCTYKPGNPAPPIASPSAGVGIQRGEARACCACPYLLQTLHTGKPQVHHALIHCLMWVMPAVNQPVVRDWPEFWPGRNSPDVIFEDGYRRSNWNDQSYNAARGAGSCASGLTGKSSLCALLSEKVKARQCILLYAYACNDVLIINGGD